MKTRLFRVGTLAVLSIAAGAPRGVLLAQGTQAAQEQVQLAFGYECDDRFLIRNDGTQPVTVEYGLTGAEQRSSLLLQGKESTELSSAATSPLELWVNGRIVATEQHGNRLCAADPAGGVGYEQAGPIVVVRPIGEADYVSYVQPAYKPPRVVSVGVYPEYGYRSQAVVVAPLSQSHGAYGRDARVIQNGPVGRGDRMGAVRPVPSHAEPRRSAPQQYTNGGRERQAPQYAGGGWPRQTTRQQPGGGREWQNRQSPSGGRERQTHQQAGSTRERQSRQAPSGDRGHSRRRQG
jgi:hypothetical protein